MSPNIEQARPVELKPAPNAAVGAASTESYSTPATTAAQTGALPDSETPLHLVTLRDLEAQARKIMPAYSFAYVSGGAGDECTMRENLAAFNRWVICPNSLAGQKTVDTRVQLLGSELSYPVITAALGYPSGVTRLAGNEALARCFAAKSAL